MINSATIKISPTIFSPTTVTAVTSAIMAKSIRASGHPAPAVYSGSNAAKVIGRRSSATSKTATVPPPAITNASLRSIPAVAPKRKLSNPA